MHGNQSNTATTESSPGSQITTEQSAAAVRPAARFSILTIAAAVLWLSVVIGSMAYIVHYSNVPGRVGSVPLTWPADSRIPLDAGRPTLVMFAHPRCPCTRASMGELEMLVARAQGKASVHVLFVRPAEMSEDWAQSELWRRAAAIPGVTVHRDDDGAEARRFHSETSGETVLYGSDGTLLFEGGITSSRGHSGDNTGRSSLVALLDHQISDRVTTPVFGCPLFGAECGPGTNECKP